jgi:hypothetical protein
MKETLLQMADIIHLSPARQAQIYFTVQLNVPEKSLRLTTSSSMFLESRSGVQPTHIVLAEATFHAGMAVSCLEEWLKDQDIKYSMDEKFEEGHLIAKVTLL